MQFGLTPPFVLAILPMHGMEVRHGTREFYEFIGFSLFGMRC